MDHRKFWEDQIEWSKKQIEYCNKEIEFLTRMLEMERREDREMVEWIWSRGVVTKEEMRIYNKGYQGSKTRKYLRERRREYMRRKRYSRNIKEYEKILADM